METKELDIVYCVSSAPQNEELRFSLRSLENIPHRKVWVYGGCPEWLDKRRVKCVPLEQKERNKWNNVSKLLEQIAKNEKITENFIWFNDDFFVLKKIESLDYYKDRTLIERIYDFAKMGWWQLNGPYQRKLKEASRALKMVKLPTNNYELHIPIVYNRHKFLELYKRYPNVGAKRSLYCNTFGIKGVQRKDIKIYDNENVPEKDWDFVSTTNDSFEKGKVGEYLRKKFNKKSKYEKEDEWTMGKVK